MKIVAVWLPHQIYAPHLHPSLYITYAFVAAGGAVGQTRAAERLRVSQSVLPTQINFYAITGKRHFEPPLLKELLRRDEVDVLGTSSQRLRR